MKNLLKTEWLKIKYYRAFWWIIGLTAVAYPGINYLFYNIYTSIGHNKDQVSKMAKFLIGNPFSFPEAWHTVSYFSSYFVFLPAIVVIMFISNEYTFKTHRQNIIDGWSRNQFMLAKFIDVTIVSLIVSIILAIIAFIIGMINSNDSSGNMFDMSYYIGLFFLQTFSQLSLAFLLGFLVRKAFLSLGIFLIYFLILEPILVGVAKVRFDDIGRFLPLSISNRLIPFPAFLGKLSPEGYGLAIDRILFYVILTIILTIITWFLCFRVNSKRDL